jgi:NAD+ synthase
MGRPISELANDITDWMDEYMQKAGSSAWIVGVSGGVDSSVAARLSERTGRQTICVAMPMYLHNDSAKDSLQKAMKLCVGRRVDFHIRPIGPILEAYQACGIAQYPEYVDEANRLLAGNLRSRIRANTLYDLAGRYHGLVVGTGNRDEDEIGYFTKGGDGVVDLCPLSALHKSKVRELALFLDVPKEIVTAAPTAGLWDGQTDEGELGMTYDEVAAAIDYQDTLSDKPLNERQRTVLDRVKQLRTKNRHKLEYPPVYMPPAQDRVSF